MTRNGRIWRLVARLGLRVGLGLVGLVLAYGAAGLIGGAIPVNAAWRPPARGIEIWVESNGIHTGIVVPKVAAGIDWRPLADPTHLADPRYAAHDHLSFGWGERAFYLETPTWAQVKATTVLAAAFGSAETLVHVDHVPRPRATADVRRLVVTPDQYRRLAAYIAASVRPGARHYRGYGPYDAFYDGTGRYSALRTCNSWTGNALRSAGVRVGWWTPFPLTVMWWFGAGAGAATTAPVAPAARAPRPAGDTAGDRPTAALPSAALRRS